MRKNDSKIRYKKYFRVREWNRFEINKQMYLCRIYDVILTDHKTFHERFVQFTKNITVQNLDKGITKFNQGVDGFSKELDRGLKQFNKEMGSATNAKKITGNHRSIWD